MLTRPMASILIMRDMAVTERPHSGMLSVATHMIGPDEWLLVAPPARRNPETLRRVALAWLDSAPPSPGGCMEFVPVPSIDPVLGLAVVHHVPGGTTIYCREDDLGRAAAETLSLTATVSTPVLLTASRLGPPCTTITTVSHTRWLHPLRDRWLDPSLHPVVAHVAPPQATIYACDCQVASTLADVLTALCTEHLRLLHVGTSVAKRASVIETYLHKR